MKAILQQTLVIEVDDEEQAASLAIAIDEATRVQIIAALDEAGFDWVDAQDLFELLGTSVLMARSIA